MLDDFCYFDKKIFKKILKICLETEIEDKNLRAEILDILHFTTYLMLCHRDKKDLYKIKNFKKVEKKIRRLFSDRKADRQEIYNAIIAKMKL